MFQPGPSPGISDDEYRWTAGCDNIKLPTVLQRSRNAAMISGENVRGSETQIFVRFWKKSKPVSNSSDIPE